MKKTIKINPESRLAYVDKDFVETGFVGEVPVYVNSLTATMVKPGSKLEDVKKSLEIILRDIDLRIKNKEKIARP